MPPFPPDFYRAAQEQMHLAKPAQEPPMTDYRIEAATKEEWAERCFHKEALLDEAVKAMEKLERICMNRQPDKMPDGVHIARATLAKLRSKT